ncbi:hypothetical protein NM208_g12052 [Fusarium decemcellulare]|uniref:Uncharacterized protein n=1 Tax=Fusarium decemcellulare TaxID=57161 RepID=A0ACC1RSX1_9HYPO|nr:hypothetical protein NM208_g12052 [Fusarium decemcellulare]
MLKWVLVAAFAGSASATCYYPDGSNAAKDYKYEPCGNSTTTYSQCCYFGEGDKCLPNGLCNQPDRFDYRAACQNKDWSNCPEVCMDTDTGTWFALQTCGKNKYCCPPADGSDCCESGAKIYTLAAPDPSSDSDDDAESTQGSASDAADTTSDATNSGFQSVVRTTIVSSSEATGGSAGSNDDKKEATPVGAIAEASGRVAGPIVVLDQMPLNANGKVDRKELARRARILPKPQTAPPVPAFPITDIEVMLCEEATEVFGMDVDITDHFFKLGGHSLLATKLVSRIDNRLKVRVTVKDVFDHPVFADLAVIIRQGLALQNPIPNGQDRQGSSAGVAPRTETEIMLCEEFANVLGVQAGITDNFFDLGGHSLMATKLAVRIGHRLDATISVKDVFDYPVLFQLAKKIELARSESSKVDDDIQATDYAAFQLLSLQDPQDFIQREICPQLRFSYGTVQDVYPSTQVQKAFLFDPTTGYPRRLVPFYIDFPHDSETTALTRACESLVERLDMFRTVFLEAAGELYQVVVEHLDLAIDTIETEENVNTATSDFLDRHAQEPVRLGEPLIQMAILKSASSVRVILRMSHALYDGLSFEPIVRDLHMLYNGRRLASPTQFARYMQYSASRRRDGYDFWRDVIGNSPMTVLRDAGGGGTRRQEIEPSKAVHLSEVVDVPLQAIRRSITTQASVFNSACALVLSKESGSKDVVFGRIVSGRQGLPVSWQDIIGPCTNAVPMRARIAEDGTQQQLLRDMQDQYLRSLPFETLGFEDIKRNCTDWPEATTNYSCCVTYHNFEYHPESEVEQQRVEMGVLAKHVEIRKDEPLYDLAMAGEVEPDGINLKVTVVAKAQLFGEERVQYLLQEVCKTFQTLNLSL